MKRLLPLALLIAAVAGCGGSDADPATTAAEPPTTGEVTTTASPTASAPTTAAATTTSTSTTTTTLPDTDPPELVVASPPAGATVADPEVVFQGTVEPGVQGVWSPPDYEAVVAADGSWEVTITLPSGHNNVVFFTLDQAANETVVEHAITYTAPMPCDFFSVVAEHSSAFPAGAKDWCGGWGYIDSVTSGELVFDLAQVALTVPGDESQGWTITNVNPMLRYLPFSDDVEIRACAPAPGDTAPGICGSPWVGSESWQFSLWDVADLQGFVASSSELWNVLIDPATGEVVWVEQWWTP